MVNISTTTMENTVAYFENDVNSVGSSDENSPDQRQYDFSHMLNLSLAEGGNEQLATPGLLFVDTLDLSEILPIACLPAFRNKWTIRAFVNNKSLKIKRGGIFQLTVDFGDRSGVICAVTFDREYTCVYDMLGVNDVCYVAGSADHLYRSGTSRYMLKFAPGMKIKCCSKP